MMNSYDDNLRESLARSLGALTDQQTALLHGQSQAEAAFYHAKGAVLAAEDRLETDQRHRDDRRAVHHAAQRGHDQSIALYGTLNLAKQGSDGAIASTATAAKNLQVSADAVMQLASTIGAAMNVASAALYDTELYHQISRVNAQLNRVANQARFLALKGTEVSSKCAESIVGALADQGTDVQGRLGALKGQTQAALDDKSAVVIADEAALRDARAAEFTAHNALREARTRQEAMSSMLANTRLYANMDLRIEVLSSRRVAVNFKAFTTPVALGDRNPPPAPNARTFVAFIAQNLADQFNADRAAQLFSKWNRQPGAFTPVEPGEAQVALKQDVYGGAITSDKTYVAFLYIEPSVDYKRYLGNFGDYLSIASAPFTPLTPLPGPVHVGGAGDANRLVLAVADEGQAGQAAALILPELEAGAALVEDLVAWQRQNGASLDPGLALNLDAVVPPFSSALNAVIAALRAGEAGGARHGAASIRDLLRLMSSWDDPADPPAELGTVRSLLPELGRLIDKACLQEGEAPTLELRSILIDHAIDGGLADPARRGTLPAYFTLDTARQVAPANYVLATALDGAPDNAKVPAAQKGKDCLWFEVDLDPHGKDCFGNPLMPGHRYTPCILTTVRSTTPSEWKDTLVVLDHVWHLA